MYIDTANFVTTALTIDSAGYCAYYLPLSIFPYREFNKLYKYLIFKIIKIVLIGSDYNNNYGSWELNSWVALFYWVNYDHVGYKWTLHYIGTMNSWTQYYSWLVIL